jgi:hypothetical protein
MTRRLFAVAVAALLGLASPALAFHPFHHSCGTTHQTVAAPMTFHTVAAPVTFHTVAAPVTFHTVAAPVTFHTVAAPTTFHLVAAPTTVNTVAATGNLKATGECASAADIQRIKEDLDAIRAKLLIPPRTDAAKKADGAARPEVSPRLLAIDAGLDEIEAVQRRTEAMRAAAAQPRTTTPAEAPAVTRRN